MGPWPGICFQTHPGRSRNMRWDLGLGCVSVNSPVRRRRPGFGSQVFFAHLHALVCDWESDSYLAEVARVACWHKTAICTNVIINSDSNCRFRKLTREEELKYMQIPTKTGMKWMRTGSFSKLPKGLSS